MRKENSGIIIEATLMPTFVSGIDLTYRHS